MEKGTVCAFRLYSVLLGMIGVKKMTGEHTDEYLEKAVESEYDHCVTKHGNFKNHHEGYAVMLEEVQEVTEAASAFPVIANREMHELWNMIRKDETDGFQECIEKISDIAEELAKESIQVMAMCRKWNDLLAPENEA